MPEWPRAFRNALLLGLLTAAFAYSAGANDTVTVHGRLSAGEGLSLADVGAIVVFLEAKASMATPPLHDSRMPTAVIRQSGAKFEPGFLAVSRGQLVEMPNDDVIFHNVFSYSEPNDFDLGMYASGESRSVSFQQSGLVRIYCSIHDGMDGLIFVAPSPLFAIPDSTGHYSIPSVPPGLYQLHVWSERLPEIVAPAKAGNATQLEIDLVLGSTAGANGGS